MKLDNINFAECDEETLRILKIHDIPCLCKQGDNVFVSQLHDAVGYGHLFVDDLKKRCIVNVEDLDEMYEILM